MSTSFEQRCEERRLALRETKGKKAGLYTAQGAPGDSKRFLVEKKHDGEWYIVDRRVCGYDALIKDIDLYELRTREEEDELAVERALDLSPGMYSAFGCHELFAIPDGSARSRLLVKKEENGKWYVIDSGGTPRWLRDSALFELQPVSLDIIFKDEAALRPASEDIKPEEESDAMMFMPPNKPTESELKQEADERARLAAKVAPPGLYTAQTYPDYIAQSLARMQIEKREDGNWYWPGTREMLVHCLLYDLRPVAFTPPTSANSPSDSSKSVSDSSKSVSDGSTASYYELPIWARELQDLIRFKAMNGAQAEIFRAIYRGSEASHSDEKRQAKKVLAYAIDEVVRTHSPGQSFGPIRDAVFAVIHSLLEAGEHRED